MRELIMAAAALIVAGCGQITTLTLDAAMGDGTAAGADAGGTSALPQADSGSSDAPDIGRVDAEPPPAIDSGAISQPGPPDTHNFSYRGVDAKFSEALSSIVLVSDAPSNALYIYDVKTGAERSVPLPFAPLALAVNRTGTAAAVAYELHVSGVDLVAETVTASCATSATAYNIVLSSSGTAYFVPRTYPSDTLHAVELASCTDTESYHFLNYREGAALHPTERAVFTADQFVSPTRVFRCDVTRPRPSCWWAMDLVPGRDYCGNLWISRDGRRIYTACGVMLNVPLDFIGSQCSDAGVLMDVPFMLDLSEAKSVPRIALIPGRRMNPMHTTITEDTKVRIYETAHLGFVQELPLPDFPTSGVTLLAHGRFVFPTATMDKLFVVVQADAPDVPGSYAVITLRP